jgi:hypothetical protein
MLGLSTLLLTFSSNIFYSITVAKSTNVLAWDCTASQAIADNNFTVLCVLSIISGTPSLQLTHISINNVDPKIFQGPLAVIAMQNNADCSIVVSQNQVSQPANTGYIITMADPLNNTHVSSIFNFLYFVA